VNPRYFTVASDEGRAVYLTGSHIWNNLHDGMGRGGDVHLDRSLKANHPRALSQMATGSGKTFAAANICEP